MKTVHTIADLRAALQGADRTAFVPTMGNLHEGHLALVRMARRKGGPVVASVFVNRLQFAPHEDFDRYPRTLARDCELLQGAGCDLVFAPDEAELYPEPQTFKVLPDPALAEILEGHFRPGFFTGVATVVMKLFQCVQPAVAVFGKKDYQQLMVIRRLVRQFALPVEIVAGETSRADDGLALSSRNGYLNAVERAAAPTLHRVLAHCSGEIARGQLLARVLDEGGTEIERAGFALDYLEARHADTLQRIASLKDGPMRLLVAARIGRTRLIDNMAVSRGRTANGAKRRTD